MGIFDIFGKILTYVDKVVQDILDNSKYSFVNESNESFFAYSNDKYKFLNFKFAVCENNNPLYKRITYARNKKNLEEMFELENNKGDIAGVVIKSDKNFSNTKIDKLYFDGVIGKYIF